MRPSAFWSRGGSKWCNGIEVPFQDTRLYRALTLPNHLQVLLVSDATTEKAAAAMAVQVGHQSDPANIPGLAHFLEHMLFLGTEKFPDETSYKKFLSAHGGRSNASTSAVDTNYYFDVGPAHLHGALDRFAQFFISPLFTPTVTEREMHAVDAENAKNYQNDARRLYQLSKSLSNPVHPFHKFGTGNLTTLGHRPRAQGVDIRKELLAFYDRHYSANAMKLVVYGKEDLNVLEDWATTLFSPVANNSVESPRVADGCHPYEQPQQGREIQVVPVKDVRLLELSFPLPPVRAQYLTKPHRMLAYLFGYEGHGSLLAYFKAMGYANSLTAGLTKDFSDWAMFSIKITLTDEGVANYQTMAQACFHFINLVSAAPPDLLASYFEEAQALANLRFRFRNQEQPIHYVSWLTSNIQTFPVESVIVGPSLLDHHDDAGVRSLLKLMDPSRVRLTLVSKTVTPVATEPWLHAAYSDSPLLVESVDPSLLSDSSALYLPPPTNPFIPLSFDLMPSSSTASFKDMHVLRDDHQCRLWLKPGNSFGKPKTSLRLKFYHSLVYASPMHAVLTELFASCVRDKVAQDLYDADVAGMKVSVSTSPTGVTLHMDGYSDTLSLVVAKVLEIVVNPRLMEPSFHRLKDKLVRGYANAALDEPHVHAIQVRSWHLTTPAWSTPEKLAVAGGHGSSVTWESLVEHAMVLLQSGFTEGFVYGNVDKSQAQELMACVDRALQAVRGNTSEWMARSCAPTVAPPRRNIRLDGNYVVRERNPNKSNPNGAVNVLYQLGEDSPTMRATSALLAQLIKVPCFSTLRTNEQLGYLVSSGQYISHNVVYVYISIQSNKYSPLHLQARVDEFCRAFHSQLQRSLVDGDDDFQQHQASVVAQLVEAPKTYEQDCDRLWHDITSESYDFGLREKVAAVVPTLTLASVVDVVYGRLVNPASRHRLSVQIFAPTDNIPPHPGVDATVIGDRSQFKKRMGLFPARARHAGVDHPAKL
ncbi:hypothetical protein H310_06363 [Aphanomyces invadans]|uniref:Uncharacterized protein n=1 Tax=Aphanomyces invadans TaxID=157072 RepID=A0A024U6C8_9STRA|nr:hypothetical protein H310_06363 [Aphanomyces invadans]ETW01780.1 hypothetical protein H310_06363 [Aphanomyces invadans]|eukprot:XP_008869628.1 hypothetical protein H310_06363 [Aphanomyces invadans]